MLRDACKKKRGYLLQLFMQPGVFQRLTCYQQCFQVTKVTMTECMTTAEAIGNNCSESYIYLFTYGRIINVPERAQTSESDTRCSMTPAILSLVAHAWLAFRICLLVNMRPM